MTPIVETQKAPTSHSPDVNTGAESLFGTAPDFSQPTHLFIPITTKMRFGDGYRKPVSLPALYKNCFRLCNSLSADAHSFDVYQRLSTRIPSFEERGI
jgi:hypothetical protein